MPLRPTIIFSLGVCALAGLVSAGVLHAATEHPGPIDEASSCMADCLDDASLDEGDAITCVLNCRETVERLHSLDRCESSCLTELGDDYLDCRQDESGSDEFTCRLQSDNAASVCWDDCQSPS